MQRQQMRHCGRHAVPAVQTGTLAAHHPELWCPAAIRMGDDANCKHHIPLAAAMHGPNEQEVCLAPISALDVRQGRSAGTVSRTPHLNKRLPDDIRQVKLLSSHMQQGSLRTAAAT